MTSLCPVVSDHMQASWVRQESNVRIEIVGGPFDGGMIVAPRRTAPDLLFRLESNGTQADYRFIRAGGRNIAAPESAQWFFRLAREGLLRSQAGRGGNEVTSCSAG